MDRTPLKVLLFESLLLKQLRGSVLSPDALHVGLLDRWRVIDEPQGLGIRHLVLPPLQQVVNN